LHTTPSYADRYAKTANRLISRNKASGRTTWLDVERQQPPAGLLRFKLFDVRPRIAEKYYFKDFRDIRPEFDPE
jgi:hypothetical protein